MLKRFYTKGPAPFILAIFLIKLIIVVLLVLSARQHDSRNFFGLAAVTEDTDTYIGPIDHFISEGNYYWGHARAGRMPYYGLAYYPLRLLFSKTIAFSILVILQTLLESVAIYYLARACAMLMKTSCAFWLYLGLACISLYNTYYNYYIFPESMSSSLLGLFFYQYVLFLTQDRQNKRLLLAGLFLALTSLLKPFMGLLYLVVLIELLRKRQPKALNLPFRRTAFLVLLACGPVVLLNTPWTIRNALIFHKLMALQEDKYGGYNYSNARLEARYFMQIMGESFIFWEKNTAGCYFEPRVGKPCNYVRPARMTAPPLSKAMLDDARETYIAYQSHPSDSLGLATIAKFQKLSALYYRSHKADVLIVSRLRIAKKFLIHSGSYYLPLNKPASGYTLWQWCVKLMQSGLYYLCLVGGLIGGVLLWRFNGAGYMAFVIPAYVVFFIAIVYRLDEYRYFHITYPFLMVGTCFLLFKIAAIRSPNEIDKSDHR